MHRGSTVWLQTNSGPGTLDFILLIRCICSNCDSVKVHWRKLECHSYNNVIMIALPATDSDWITGPSRTLPFLNSVAVHCGSSLKIVYVRFAHTDMDLLICPGTILIILQKELLFSSPQKFHIHRQMISYILFLNENNLRNCDRN